MRPRIGLDFDDTLLPTREWIIAKLNAQHGTAKDPETLLDIFVTRFWGYSDADFAAFFLEHDAEIHQMPAYDRCAETLQQWAETADLYIITGRSPEWCSEVPAWLGRHGIVVQDVLTAHEQSKGELAADVGIELFVEDYGPHALSVAERGVPVLMLDRCYNRAVRHERITRVKDWPEIATARQQQMCG